MRMSFVRQSGKQDFGNAALCACWQGGWGDRRRGGLRGFIIA